MHASNRFICGRYGPMRAEDLPTEAQLELADFQRWLALPRPRPEFHEWRRSPASVSPGRICPICKGTKSVAVKENPVIWGDCPACNGTGRTEGEGT